MPAWLLAAALFASFGIRALPAQEVPPSDPPMQAGCEVDYPPFCTVHEDGRADGFSVALMREALARMGRDVTFRTGPWADVRGWLERGEIEALPLVGRTPEREALFDFTVPYLTMHGAIVVREGTTDIRSMSDLRGRRVGAMKGDNAEEFLRREERGLDIVTTPTFTDALHALSDGRCDAVVIQRLVARRLLGESGLDNLRIVERPIMDFAQDFCFAVKEGDRETLALLNEGLALVVADGTHRRLHAKWFAALQLPSDRPLVVGGDHNYPPFEFLDERGRPCGFTVDLTRAIAREMNMDIRIRLGPWEDIVGGLEGGEIDAIQGMFYTPERDRTLDFSPQYLASHYVGVARKGGPAPPEALDQLADLDVAVQAGDAIMETIGELDIDARLSTFETQEEVLRAVVEGHVDCGIVVRLSAQYLIEQRNWGVLQLGERALYTGEYCYAVPHGRDALLTQFSEGLRTLRHTDDFRRIYEKWLGVYEPGVPARTVLRYVGMVAGPLLVVALLALLWSWSLRRTVAERTHELRESLDRFQAVFEAANVGKSMTLPSGEVNVNKAFADMLGYTPEELRGRTWQELTPPEDVPQSERYIAPLLEGQESATRFEKRYVRRDGETVWADVSVSIRRDAQGRPLHFITTIVDITERKRAEIALGASNEYQRAMIACSPVALYSVDMDGNVLTWNEASERVFGWTADQVIGRPLPIVPEDKREEFASLRNQVANGRSFTGKELVRLRNDGTQIPISLSVAPILNGEGHIVGIMGAAEDISDRKRHEARIAHLNQVLRAIRDVNQLITHETDRDKLLQRSCDILISTRGYRSAWVVLRGADGSVQSAAESGIGEDFAVLRQSIEQGEWPECCLRARRQPDGIVPMHGTDRNCKGCVLTRSSRDTAALAGALRYGERDFGVLVVALPAGLADDAEEQSLFRELVGDVAYALSAMESTHRRREEEAKFRSYVENAPYGIFLADRSGQYVDVNPAACDITGYTRDELLAMGIPDLLPEEAKERGMAHFRTLLEQGRSDGESAFTRKSGEIGSWHVLAVALGPNRFLGFVEDITERERAEAEHERLQDQLLQAQKMESVGRLAGGVAHDFNNLLMGIMNYTELCRDAVGKDHPVREWLDEITAEAQRSANLTRQLLAFARKQTIAPEILDLNDAVGGMLKMLRRLIGEDIDLSWQPCVDVWAVEMDPGQVDQLLVNLCVNARDAIGGVGEVTIETANATIDRAYCASNVDASPGGYVMLAVSDSGCGMDRETLEHVFEPFFTTKPTGEGTGLGLATVFGIVKQNGGFVNVYSEPGEGTTFRIYLPQHVGDEEVPEGMERLPERVGGSETILLVEDEKSVRVTTALFLEQLGYTVLTAETPAAALQTAHEHEGGIHLLVTDVVMPGMSGRDLATELLREYSSMKCLFISGYTANVIAHRGILDADVEFLAKPFSRDDVVRKVREVLDA